MAIIGGAGGQGGLIGDMWYGDLRRPFTEAGMWGLLRVLPEESCAVKRLDGTACGPRPTPAPAPTPENPAPLPEAPTATPSPSPTPATPSRPAPRAQEPTAEATPGVEAAAPEAQAVTAVPAPQVAPVAEAPRVQRLRDLVVPRSIAPRTLRRGGLEFRVTVPDSARAIAVELVRGRRVVARATVRISAGGAQKIRWRLPAATAKRLAAGRYTLRVRAGKDARSIGPDRLERTLELRAAPR
jgi:hypothetical protein